MYQTNIYETIFLFLIKKISFCVFLIAYLVGQPIKIFFTTKNIPTKDD